MAGEKILIARQDTLEAVQRDTQAILADNAAIGGDMQGVLKKGNEIMNLLGNAAGNVANGSYQMYGQGKTQGTLDQNMILLDIQGRGKLFWAYFYSGFRASSDRTNLRDTDTYFDVKITIDGEVFLYVRVRDYNAAQSSSADFSIIDVQNTIANSIGNHFLPSFLGYIAPKDSIKTVQPSQEIQKIDADDSVICPIRNFITFEQSLRVEGLLHSDATLKETSTQYCYTIGCILDE